MNNMSFFVYYSLILCVIILTLDSPDEGDFSDKSSRDYFKGHHSTSTDEKSPLDVAFEKLNEVKLNDISKPLYILGH